MVGGRVRYVEPSEFSMLEAAGSRPLWGLLPHPRWCASRRATSDDGDPLTRLRGPSHPADWSVLLIDDASKRTAIAETQGHDARQVLAREPAIATLPSRAMRMRVDAGARTTELADSKAKKARNA